MLKKAEEKLYKILSPNLPPKRMDMLSNLSTPGKISPKKWALMVMSAEKFLLEGKATTVREITPLSK